MKTKDILNLDLTEKHNRHILAQALHKIPELEGYTDKMINEGVFENIIFDLCTECNLYIKGIYGDVWANNEGIVWRMCISGIDYKFSVTVYGVTLFEVLAKSLIGIYPYVKKVRKRRGDDEWG